MSAKSDFDMNKEVAKLEALRDLLDEKLEDTTSRYSKLKGEKFQLLKEHPLFKGCDDEAFGRMRAEIEEVAVYECQEVHFAEFLRPPAPGEYDYQDNMPELYAIDDWVRKGAVGVSRLEWHLEDSEPGIYVEASVNPTKVFSAPEGIESLRVALEKLKLLSPNGKVRISFSGLGEANRTFLSMLIEKDGPVQVSETGYRATSEKWVFEDPIEALSYHYN